MIDGVRKKLISCLSYFREIDIRFGYFCQKKNTTLGCWIYIVQVLDTFLFSKYGYQIKIWDNIDSFEYMGMVVNLIGTHFPLPDAFTIFRHTDYFDRVGDQLFEFPRSGVKTLLTIILFWNELNSDFVSSFILLFTMMLIQSYRYLIFFYSPNTNIKWKF